VKFTSELRDVTCQWDHTVFICHPTGQVGTRFIDYLPRKDKRLSWPSWLVTFRDGLPVHRQY